MVPKSKACGVELFDHTVYIIQTYVMQYKSEEQQNAHVQYFFLLSRFSVEKM